MRPRRAAGRGLERGALRRRGGAGRRPLRRVALALAAGLAVLPSLRDAAAHVVFGARTLSQLVTDADVVARARILDAHAVLTLDTPPLRRPVCRAELVEVLKGDLAPGTLRFAQHGHGAAEFVDGEEVLLFLRRIERSRELADLALSGALQWVSLQEHDARWETSGGSRSAFVAAAREYAALAARDDPAARLAALSRATLRLLGSAEPRLAASALSDLVRSPSLPLVRAADLPALLPLLDDPAAGSAQRAGLLAELERRGLVEGAPRWVRLLREVPAADRPALVRLAGAHPSPQLTEELLRLLRGPEPEVAEEAALALGAADPQRALAPLVEALAAPEPRLRGAALRGLAALGTPEARAALEHAAASHPDTAVRRSARAAAARLASRPLPSAPPLPSPGPPSAPTGPAAP